MTWTKTLSRGTLLISIKAKHSNLIALCLCRVHGPTSDWDREETIQNTEKLMLGTRRNHVSKPQAFG